MRCCSSIARVPDTNWGRGLPALLHEATDGSPRLLLEQLQVAMERGRIQVGECWLAPDPATLAAQLAEPPTAMPMTLLVSPFIAEGDSDAEYLVTGITEGLIGDLSRVEGLRVIAPASAMRVKGVADLRARAAAVGARYVLEGRVNANASRLDVVAHLRDAANGLLIREELCSVSRIEWLDPRERIVRAVGEGLRVPLRAAEALKVQDRPTDMHAYDCYLTGPTAVSAIRARGDRTRVADPPIRT